MFPVAKFFETNLVSWEEKIPSLGQLGFFFKEKQRLESEKKKSENQAVRVKEVEMLLKESRREADSKIDRQKESYEEQIEQLQMANQQLKVCMYVCANTQLLSKSV
ncbi:hypothetical protein GQR58_018718 [Nymphon striatum]|nr:hypothetical protein GQR58_018718 [Nymphon striatum]